MPRWLAGASGSGYGGLEAGGGVHVEPYVGSRRPGHYDIVTATHRHPNISAARARTHTHTHTHTQPQLAADASAAWQPSRRAWIVGAACFRPLHKCSSLHVCVPDHESATGWVLCCAPCCCSMCRVGCHSFATLPCHPNRNARTRNRFPEGLGATYLVSIIGTYLSII